MQSFSGRRVAALSLSLFLIVCVITTPAGAQKKNKEQHNDDDEQGVSSRYEGEGSRNSCGCRGLQNQIDSLETRLDRMIDLWNDFVDRNQDQYPGPGGGNRRPPPQGGRGPYPYPERDRDRPGYGSGRMPPAQGRPGSGRGYTYDMRSDDFEQTPRRFRF